MTSEKVKTSVEFDKGTEIFEDIQEAVVTIFRKDLYKFEVGPARSKRGNLGPCPHPWCGVVTDPQKHSYLPRFRDYMTQRR